jgi:hypothetical protein
MLQRVLASHSAISTHPEPHIITPLAYLGFYDCVDKAPYDAVNSAQAQREFVQALPRGEEDYLDALRALTDTLYDRVLAPTNKRYFVDKTPAYALVLPFLAKLYPSAKYIVLTRHPGAITHSVAHSFFGGDYAAAQQANPIISRYIPAIAAFLTEAPVALVHVRYEDLVEDPHGQMQRLCAYLDLPYEESSIEYGAHEHIAKSFGDPVGVAKHTRPVATSVNTWAQDLKARPEALALLKKSCAELDPADLKAFGYPPESLFDALNQAQKSATRRNPFESYQLQRKLLLSARRYVGDNALGHTLRRVRYACDVLLRNPTA